jgi:hypothetical protein
MKIKITYKKKLVDEHKGKYKNRKLCAEHG